MSALRQKMIEDMQIRNYSPHTIEAYVRCVAHFARYFGKSPDMLTPAHVREYQIHLVKQRKDCWGTLVQTVCALRFFYQQTLGRKWMIDFIPTRSVLKSCPSSSVRKRCLRCSMQPPILDITPFSRPSMRPACAFQKLPICLSRTSTAVDK